jgi:pyridinium-3,5-biscarboxylic acid mononucleotide sulfurtransferase
VIDEKERRLRALIQGYGSCLVAYSGGVDSAYLARVAFEVLGPRALAVIADSPSLPRAELAAAVALAEANGIPLRVIKTREFSDPRYLANPTDRCYFCKHALFDELVPLARSKGFAVIAYGENASDVGDHRPGARAAAEARVCAPLKESGLLKAEIRELSARLGLPTADKPEAACLSSRVMTGEVVTPEKLAMIETAEACLRRAGFREVRVRHHELAATAFAPVRHLARIEVGVSEMGLLLAEGLRDEVQRLIAGAGYAHVTFDLAGYKRGGGNAVPLAFRASAANAVTQPALRSGPPPA